MLDDAIEQRYALYALGKLYGSVDAKAIVVSGWDRKAANQAMIPASSSEQLITTLIYTYLQKTPVIMVQQGNPGTKNEWYIRYNIPEQVDIKKVRSVFVPLMIRFGPPVSNIPIQWNRIGVTFSILRLAPIKNKLLFQDVIEQRKYIEDEVIRLFNQNKLEKVYKPPSWQDITIIRRNILIPLLNNRYDEMTTVSAQLTGVQVVHLDVRGRKFWQIHSLSGWGDVFIAEGKTRPWLLIVPAPFKVQGIAQEAARLFTQYRFKALYMAGRPLNMDIKGHTTDILNTPLDQSMAGALTRAFLKVNQGNNTLAAMLQVASKWRFKRDTVILSIGDEVTKKTTFPTSVQALIYELNNTYGRVRLFSGQLTELGLQGTENPIAYLIRSIHTANFVHIWLRSDVIKDVITAKKLSLWRDVFDNAGLHIEDFTGAYKINNNNLKFCNNCPYLRAFCASQDLPALKRLLNIRGAKIRVGLDHHTHRLYIIKITKHQRNGCIMYDKNVRVLYSNGEAQ